jgi:hypothetical protein
VSCTSFAFRSRADWNVRLLVSCARNSELTFSLLEYGYDPSTANSESMKTWPLPEVDEEDTGDPFSLLVIRKCVEIDPGA